MKSQKAYKHWMVISTLVTGAAFNSSAADLIVKRPGRAPSSELKMKQSKVPQYQMVQRRIVNGKTELVRSKAVPRLNIGEEPALKASSVEAMALPAEKQFREHQVSERPKPPEFFIEKLLLNPVKPAAPAKTLVSLDPKTRDPEAPRFLAVTLPPLAEPKPELTKTEEMPPAQMKLLQALIFLEIKKDFNMALALFAELLDEAEVKTEATYQLALTSKALGLYSEYKHRMMQVLKDSSNEWQKKAALSLAKSAAEGDKELVAILDPKIEALKLDLAGADQYQINRAKYYMDKSDLTKSFAAVDEILMDSPLYTDSLFLKSLLLYKGGHVQEAIGLQQAVLKEVLEKRPKSEFKSIVALTLARLHFQGGQYKEAFDNYLKVDKSHPEWLQAMVEQAWSQILSEDYEGAAGNMFSLHTDFFKKAFVPESYVVRTVGYLNLCQYGDGARVVYDFKKKYTPVLKQMKAYGSRMSTPVNYYDTIKSWAQNPDLKTVDGLPREFIFALTRHPSFIMEQKMINSIEDQTAKLNKISADLVRTERKALAAQSDARTQLIDLKKKLDTSKAETDKASLLERISYQEKRLLSARIQHYIAKKARHSIKELRSHAAVRLDKEKAMYRDLAGKAVQNRYNQMVLKLNESLDQSEILQYELYSGAGEHIRFQMAGGDISSKERPELKVAKEKALNWEFRGEIWEDELGHYRSSLKNVCPPEEKLSSHTMGN
jgi:hypothetical protein